MFIAAYKTCLAFDFCTQYNNIAVQWTSENYWDFEQNDKLSALKQFQFWTALLEDMLIKTYVFVFLVIKYFRPQFQNPGNHQIIYDEKD